MQDGAAKCGACGAAAGASAPVAAASGGGITDNMAGALAYITIVGIIFLLIEPYNKNKFVRFHSFQSIFYCAGLIVFWIVWEIMLVILGIVSHGLAFVIGTPISLLIWLGSVVVWFFLVYKAYNNEQFKLPIIGDFAAKQAGV
jgi:uncharacterized membrane protein